LKAITGTLFIDWILKSYSKRNFQPVFKMKGSGGSAPVPVWVPMLLMKKCSFMHKMCQIPRPHRRLGPLSPLLDLATLTTTFNRADEQLATRIKAESNWQGVQSLRLWTRRWWVSTRVDRDEYCLMSWGCWDIAARQGSSSIVKREWTVDLRVTSHRGHTTVRCLCVSNDAFTPDVLDLGPTEVVFFKYSTWSFYANC